MSTRGRIVVLDENEATRTWTCAALESAGYEVVPVATLLGLKTALAPNRPTILLCDVSPPLTRDQALSLVPSALSVAEGRARVILCGTQTAQELSAMARACGAAGSVERRSDPVVLLRGVRQLLAAPRTPLTPDSLESIAARSSPTWTIVKLLLIDDSEITLALMQERLRSRGFDVRIALSLGEVQAIIHGWSPNVIIADVNMPDMRGDDLCARLKAAAATRDALVMLCSGMPEDDLARVAQSAGADGFVCKAKGVDHLVTAIETQCRRLSDAVVSFE